MFTNVHDVIIMSVVQFQIFLVYILCNFFVNLRIILKI